MGSVRFGLALFGRARLRSGWSLACSLPVRSRRQISVRFGLALRPLLVHFIHVSFCSRAQCPAIGKPRFVYAKRPFWNKIANMSCVLLCVCARPLVGLSWVPASPGLPWALLGSLGLPWVPLGSPDPFEL